MDRWEQSLPRRRMETNKRIEIALQQKEREGIFNDVGEKDVDAHS